MKDADLEKEKLIHQCLVQNYEKYYKLAYSYTFQEQDALDIVQEGAYRAILKSRSLKQPEYADTWICRIIINEAFRYLKKNRKNVICIEELPEEGQTDQMEDPDLKRALASLNQEERAIVVLRYFEEEKLEDIGEIMELNVNTVKSRLYRAMGKLRKFMEIGGAGNGQVEEGV